MKLFLNAGTMAERLDGVIILQQTNGTFCD
jgi:hypothetical protein